MDRSLESRIWRRSTTAGFLALAISMGGQFASVTPTQQPSCSMHRVANHDWVFDRVGPSHVSIVQKIAKAALALALRAFS